MRLNMLTVDRSPHENYVHGTLASLVRSDWPADKVPLTFCVGNAKQDYLERYSYDVLPWDGPPFETRWISFVDNYVRALRHGDGDLIVCEDDIEFTPHWFRRLADAVAEIERKHRRYVLSLYAARHPGRQWFHRAVHYRRYHPQRFFGTQAVYYPESIRKELADFMEAHRRRRPGDLLIGEWCGRPENRFLYALRGSVVQHVGAVSTGLGDGQHRAWNLLT